MSVVPNAVWYFLGFDPTNPSDWVNMSTISEEIISDVMKELNVK